MSEPARGLETQWDGQRSPTLNLTLTSAFNPILTPALAPIPDPDPSPREGLWCGHVRNRRSRWCANLHVDVLLQGRPLLLHHHGICRALRRVTCMLLRRRRRDVLLAAVAGGSGGNARLVRLNTGLQHEGQSVWSVLPAS